MRGHLVRFPSFSLCCFSLCLWQFFFDINLVFIHRILDLAFLQVKTKIIQLTRSLACGGIWTVFPPFFLFFLSLSFWTSSWSIGCFPALNHHSNIHKQSFESQSLENRKKNAVKLSKLAIANKHYHHVT